MSKKEKNKDKKKEVIEGLRPLTPQMEHFCNEYIRIREGEQAAIKAGYSIKTARVQASQLLTKLNIRYRIRDLLEEQMKRIKLSSDHVLKELLKVSSIDIRDAYDEDGKLKPIHELPEHIAKAIAGIETEELFDGRGNDRERIGYAKKIKLFDKIKSLELLGKHFKLFTDITEHRGLENLAEQLKKARQRTIQCQKNSHEKKK